jgi:K+-sensing histidine kinase KdpD
LKNNPKTCDIPIIFMTSLTDSMNKMKGFLAGGADYITKPLQHEEVLARISAHLKIRQLERQLQDQAIVLKEKEAIIALHRQSAEKVESAEPCRAYYDRLLAGISYDLQYPFNDLIGLFRRTVGNLDEYGIHEIKGQLDRLHTLAEELYASHENLLVWAANQHGLLECAPESLDLYELAAYNIVRFTPQAEKKKMVISSSIHEKTLVYADYNMVDTVIRNLLSNAIKYSEMEGQVSMMAHVEKEQVKVSVSDTGRGIAEELLPHLFDIEPVDVQGKPAERVRIGFGLVLCRELLERNAGTIRCQSEFGKGTTVTFTLPRTADISVRRSDV